MAHLFSHKLLQENIKNLIIPEMEEKIAVLQSWVNAIENKSIYQKTESECEQAFNLDIFHKVLGYSFYPTENYTLEAKGGNEVSGQKADATLGCFNVSDIAKNVSLVQVAVEIKDANTPLTKSQRREGNLSPIQQGFKYKPQYNNCKRVLVTNFVEIRLFKDTQLDYEVWNLVDLINPENEYHNFKVFWYLLNAKNLISHSGASKTEKLLSEVKIKSEQITKSFYKHYKSLRFELINDIRKLNPRISVETVVQKSQKIIDRLVFAFFCEDNDLLPQGKIKSYIEKARSMDFTPWELLKRVFKGIDSGSEMLDIPKPGYNGGLFHPDALLDSLQISDTICQKFINLGEYDFKEELSVNILGHIFEQSISDLEEIRIDLLGTKLKINELGESSKSNKRKKDGIFYTPEYIVDYIVRNSLGKYLEEQFEAIEHKHLKKEKQMSDKVYQEKQLLIYGEYKQVLENITVLDPACGSGAFLVNVFDYLLAEHKRVGEALGMGSLFDNESTYKSILQRNIYGVDLNAESVEITKLSLWLKTAEKGKKLADLDGNIKCGNSLIDDPTVAGDKAFDWKKEFADIMNAGGFDVVVGNPPYVRQELFKDIKSHLQKKYECYNSIADLYTYFIELGIRLIHKQGKFSLILPNKFIKANYGKEIRSFILSNAKFEILFDFDDYPVFEDATTYPIIFVISKTGKSNNFLYSSINSKTKGEPTTELAKKAVELNMKELSSEARILESSNTNQIIEKMKKNSISLQNLVEDKIFRGVSTGKNEVFIIGEEILQGLVTNENKHNFRKIVTGKEVKRYSLDFDNKYILFIPRDYDLESDNNIKNYLLKHQSILSERPEVKEKRFNWWCLSRYGSKNATYLFQPKIIYPRINNECNFYYDNTGDYSLSDNNFFISTNDEYLVPILNSKLLFFYIKSFASTLSGGYFDFRRPYIESLPIKKITISEKEKLTIFSKEIHDFNKQFQEKLDFTLRFLQSKFSIEKPSTKLSKFRELDFAGFLKELKVKKLSLDTEAELMRYFEKEKAEVITLKTQIDTLDKQIDDMVFDLYELTKEERKVVLDS